MTVDDKELNPVKENAIVGWFGDTLDVREAKSVMVRVDGRLRTVSNEEARALVNFPDDVQLDDENP